MKQFSFLSLLLLFSSMHISCTNEQTLLIAKLKNNNSVEIIKLDASKDADIFSQGKKLFIKTFQNAYKELTPEQLYLENKTGYLESFLEVAWEDENNDFKNKKNNSLFVVARDITNNKIIGFVAYDSIGAPTNTVYIRQLAIDPAYQKQGLGKILVLDVVKIIAQHQPVLTTVCTRTINKTAIDFYHALGFQDTAIQNIHPELPGFKYCAFSLRLNN